MLVLLSHDGEPGPSQSGEGVLVVLELLAASAASSSLALGLLLATSATSAASAASVAASSSSAASAASSVASLASGLEVFLVSTALESEQVVVLTLGDSSVVESGVGQVAGNAGDLFLLDLDSLDVLGAHDVSLSALSSLEVGLFGQLLGLELLVGQTSGLLLLGGDLLLDFLDGLLDSNSFGGLLGGGGLTLLLLLLSSGLLVLALLSGSSVASAAATSAASLSSEGTSLSSVGSSLASLTSLSVLSGRSVSALLTLGNDLAIFASLSVDSLLVTFDSLVGSSASAGAVLSVEGVVSLLSGLALESVSLTSVTVVSGLLGSSLSSGNSLALSTAFNGSGLGSVSGAIASSATSSLGSVGSVAALVAASLATLVAASLATLVAASLATSSASATAAASAASGTSVTSASVGSSLTSLSAAEAFLEGLSLSGRSLLSLGLGGLSGRNGGGGLLGSRLLVLDLHGGLNFLGLVVENLEHVLEWFAHSYLLMQDYKKE